MGEVEGGVDGRELLGRMRDDAKDEREEKKEEGNFRNGERSEKEGAKGVKKRLKKGVEKECARQGREINCLKRRWSSVREESGEEEGETELKRKRRKRRKYKGRRILSKKVMEVSGEEELKGSFRRESEVLSKEGR